MTKILLLFLSLSGLLWAIDAWDKVRELKSGAELKVYLKGQAQPTLAAFDQLTEESLLVVVKREQKAIARETIERIDARPKGRSRMTKETRTTREEPKHEVQGPTVPTQAKTGDGTSTSNSVSWDKPGFETVYRRLSGPAKP